MKIFLEDFISGFKDALTDTPTIIVYFWSNFCVMNVNIFFNKMFFFVKSGLQKISFTFCSKKKFFVNSSCNWKWFMQCVDCETLMIFMPFRFYVKSILRNLFRGWIKSFSNSQNAIFSCSWFLQSWFDVKLKQQTILLYLTLTQSISRNFCYEMVTLSKLPQFS